VKELGGFGILVAGALSHKNVSNKVIKPIIKKTLPL
jgi:hypothetical protein